MHWRRDGQGEYMALTGNILTPAGWIAGTVAFDAAIGAVSPHAVAPDAPSIMPGFVDLHVPGGGGGDVMADADPRAAGGTGERGRRHRSCRR